MLAWYRGISAPVRIAIQVCLIIGALGLLVSLLLSPRIRKVASLRPQVAQIERQIETGQRRVTDVNAPTDVERRAWDASRAELLAKLPPDDDLPKLVEALTLLAGRSRVVDLLITTAGRVPLKEEAPSPLLGEAALAKAQRDLGVGLGYYPIQITFRATYRELARFLEGLQHLSPLVTVTSLEVRRGVPYVGVQMGLRAYHSGSDGHGSG